MRPNADGNRSFEHAGCSIGFSEEGQGPPVLFIQGTGLHGDGWLPQLEDISSDHRCIWFDNRGMGRSLPVGAAPIRIEQMAEDALAVLDHLGVQNAHVVGHSLGGCIALALALAAPERVRSLALLCTSADGAGLTKMDAAVLWRGLRMQLGTLRSRRRAFLEMVLTPAEREQIDLDAKALELEPVFGHDLAVTPPIVFKQVRAMSRWNVVDRLGEIRVPTYVLGGELDVIAKPELVRALGEGIPHATVEYLSDAAHGLTVTRAEHVNRRLRAHLSTQTSASYDLDQERG